jgi:hypothetical protein
MKRLPVVEQLAVQLRQEEQSPNRVQVNLGEQIPIAPREAHGVPLGAKVRNVMSLNNKRYFVVRVRGCRSSGSLCFQ